jgi:hypothetical protein
MPSSPPQTSPSDNVLRFPGVIGPQFSTTVRGALPGLETFDAAQAKTLHSIVENAVAKADILTGFVRSNREHAAEVGLEGIGLEITMIQESNRFKRLRNALEESVRLGEEVTLTHDGLGKIHRLEVLVSEGSEQLSRFTGNVAKALSGRRLSQSSFSQDILVYGALFVAGVVVLTLAVTLLETKKQS